MKNDITKQSLAKFIAKNISYDGSGKEDCPHCGKEIRSMNYWVDHKDSLAGEIAGFIGLGPAMYTVIRDIVENAYYVSGSPAKDSKEITEVIFTEIFNEN
jgi:hypothetical protein